MGVDALEAGKARRWGKDAEARAGLCTLEGRKPGPLIALADPPDRLHLPLHELLVGRGLTGLCGEDAQTRCLAPILIALNSPELGSRRFTTGCQQSLGGQDGVDVNGETGGGEIVCDTEIA